MIKVSMEIESSLDRVWKYFLTADNWINWYGGGLKEVVPTWQKDARLVWTLGGHSLIKNIIPHREIAFKNAWTDTKFIFQEKGNDKTVVERIESDPKRGAFFSDGGAAHKADLQKTLQRLRECIEIAEGTTPKDISSQKKHAGDEKGYEFVIIDGREHRTVKIGDQIWLAENLKVTHYRNGEEIPYVKDMFNWGRQYSAAYCAYENEESHAETYGYLYNWYAGVDDRHLAPEGWRVPADEDWKVLEKHLGMSQSAADSTSWRGKEGDKLKEEGTDHWASPNIGDINGIGFSALPGGLRSAPSDQDKGKWASFWTSTEFRGNYAWGRILHSMESEICRDYFAKQVGKSVRLVKDI